MLNFSKFKSLLQGLKLGPKAIIIINGNQILNYLSEEHEEQLYRRIRLNRNLASLVQIGT